MKTNHTARSRAVWASLALLCLFAAPLSAQQLALFRYSKTLEGTVRIDRYLDLEASDVEIPSEIDGKPVTSISNGVFSGCSGLISVTIPASVTEIRSPAFSGCSGLTSIKVDALNPNYSSLDGVLFDHGGTRLIEYPEGRAGVYSIPSSVTSIETHAFRSCSGLTAIEVDALNANYSSLDGVLFDQGRTQLIRYPEGKAGDYTIPNSVTEILSSAFQGGSGLTSVTIPEGVTAIGGFAFSGCSGLTSVTIPEGVSWISHGAFDDCSGLTSVTIPEGVSGIGSRAFSNCSGLTSVAIPDSVTRIFTGAFSNCSGLTSVTIPGSVTEIDGWAFSDCSGLTSVTISEGVTTIGDGAFIRCSGLTSVTIPNSVTTIGDGAFSGCRGLASIEVAALNPNYSSLDGVFFDRNRSRLIQYPEGKAGDYTIPNSVTEIGNEAFSGCSGLATVTIPGSVTEIGNEAFSRCSGLATVTIPGSVTTIGNGAFSGCSGLTSVTISEGATEIWGSGYGLPGAFEGCNSLHTAIFLGDAPSTFYTNTFRDAAPGFTIFYLGDSSGFTSPTWKGYPAVRIDEQVYPAAAWLARNELPYDTDLHQDLNGDGVNLLMAYALDLDPNQNLQGSLPLPVIGDDGLSISFHAASEGITYTVQTSTDLKAWTNESVTMSEIDDEGQRTAGVDREGGQRFIRLSVERE